MSKYLIELRSTMKDIIQLQKPLTVEKLVSYILKWYEIKSLVKLKRSDIPIMTETLFKKTKLVIKACSQLSSNFDENMATRIQQRIRKTITTVNQSCLMAKKQAPTIPWNITKKIANHLWQDISIPRGSNITAIRKRKAAATALLLSAKCGGRWIDTHRIFWEDLKFRTEKSTKFVQAPLRFSKNNLTNNLPQALSWASSNNTADCPWFYFKRWWLWCGKPRKGLVFADGKGQMLDGSCTMRYVKIAAKSLNLPIRHIPWKHSGRVTTVLSLDKLNLSKRSIIRHMNWKTDTMLNYYMNQRSMCTTGAPAHVLSQLEPGELETIQEEFD